MEEGQKQKENNTTHACLLLLQKHIVFFVNVTSNRRTSLTSGTGMFQFCTGPEGKSSRASGLLWLLTSGEHLKKQTTCSRAPVFVIARTFHNRSACSLSSSDSAYVDSRGVLRFTEEPRGPTVKGESINRRNISLAPEN